MDRTEAFEKIHRVIYDFAQEYSDGTEEVSMDRTDEFTYELLDMLGFETGKVEVTDEEVKTK